MLERLKIILKKYPKDHTYLVGVSGGCDSMCLLDILVKLGYNVAVCHVNYNLRHDTIEDYTIVSEYCKKHNIPFHYKEVKNYWKENFQQMARKIRYDFYYEVGTIYNSHDVFLGHHKDDILETILMQKERQGHHIYWGIKSESDVMNNHILRILLEFSKQDIIEYCHKYHILYHDDYTNFETVFKRDYIRNVVLKNMSIENKEKLLLEARIHNEQLQIKQERLANILNQVYRSNVLYFKEIKEDDLEDVIRFWLHQLLPEKKISQAVVSEVVRGIKSDKPNIKIMLSVNLMFIKEYDNGYIQNKEEQASYFYEIEEGFWGEKEYFKVAPTGNKNQGIYVDSSMFPLIIRSFKPGDKIKMKFGTKKVSRLFIDHKIPAKLRKVWPIVVSQSGEILLIPDIAKNLSQIDTKPNVFVIELMSKILEE